MAAKHRFPTRKQLEEGVVIRCKGSGDPDLQDLYATHVRLMLCDGLEEPDDEDEPLTLGPEPDEFNDLGEAKLYRRQDLNEAWVATQLEVHVRVPHRQRWFYAGSAGDVLDTPWRVYDSRALESYVSRLVDARNLDELLDLDEDEDGDWEEYEEPVGSKVVHVSGDAEFRREVLSSDLPVLVDFTAQWCGPCQALAPHLVKIAADREGKLKVVKVDIDADEKLAEKYGVEAVPTLLVFLGGVKVDEMEGFEGKRELARWLGEVT